VQLGPLSWHHHSVFIAPSLFPSFFFSLFFSPSLFSFFPPPFLPGHCSGSSLLMLPVGSFLHYIPPCIFLSLGSVQSTLLRCFLSAHTIIHLIPIPLIPSLYLYTFLFTTHTSTMKMEGAWSSEMLVYNHHTTQCRTPENHVLCTSCECFEYSLTVKI